MSNSQKKRPPQEFATAKYIAEHTTIPIPKHFFSGHHDTLGPYIILQRVDAYDKCMSHLTKTLNPDRSVQHVLDRSLAPTTLETIWTKAATCLLQLSRLTFPRIGSLTQNPTDGSYTVSDRPLTHNMAAMTGLCNIPRTVLPAEASTYPTADAWSTALAEMNIAQLVFQHNDAVTSADDCRKKFVARQIFRRLPREGKLMTFGFAEDGWSAQALSGQLEDLAPAPDGTGDFRLWGDDFRAGNLLMDKDGELVAAIDWEFAYVAPTQFALDPPLWLLLDQPEMWEGGVGEWVRVYEGQLETWLGAMRRAEELERERAGGGGKGLGAPLSTHMRQSWATGRFWLNYGARKSWAFDMA